MAANTTFYSIVNEIQLSKLNFTIQLTPYAAYIVLKKTTQIDEHGKPSTPSPPVFQLLQQAYLDQASAREETAKLRVALQDSMQKIKDLSCTNSSLNQWSILKENVML